MTHFSSLLYVVGRGDLSSPDRGFTQSRISTVMDALESGGRMLGLRVLLFVTPETEPFLENVRNVILDPERSSSICGEDIVEISASVPTLPSFYEATSKAIEEFVPVDSECILVLGAGAKAPSFGVYLAALQSGRETSLLNVSDRTGETNGFVARDGRQSSDRWFVRTHSTHLLNKNNPSRKWGDQCETDFKSAGGILNGRSIASLLAIDYLSRDPMLKNRVELATCIALARADASKSRASILEEVRDLTLGRGTPERLRDLGLTRRQASIVAQALKVSDDHHAELSLREDDIALAAAGVLSERITSTLDKKVDDECDLGWPYLPGGETHLVVSLTGNPQSFRQTDVVRLSSINVQSNLPQIVLLSPTDEETHRDRESALQELGERTGRTLEGVSIVAPNVSDPVAFENAYYAVLDNRLRRWSHRSVNTVNLMLNAGTMAQNYALVNAAVRVAVENSCSLVFHVYRHENPGAVDNSTVLDQVDSVRISPASLFAEQRLVIGLIGVALDNFDLKLVERLLSLLSPRNQELRALLDEYIQRNLRPRLGVESDWSARAARAHDAAAELLGQSRLAGRDANMSRREFTVRLSQILDDVSRKSHPHECPQRIQKPPKWFQVSRNVAFHDPWSDVHNVIPDLPTITDCIQNALNVILHTVGGAPRPFDRSRDLPGLYERTVEIIKQSAPAVPDTE